jgi:hypothetical protein
MMKTLTLLAWPSFSLPMCGPRNWIGTTQYANTWSYKTLVKESTSARVSQLNGQTLRSKGTFAISVGRRTTVVHSMASNLSEEKRSKALQFSEKNPIVQAAIHSANIYWGARRNSDNFLYLNQANGSPDPLPHAVYDPKRHSIVPSFFGCDFLPQIEPTLLLGCSTGTSLTESKSANWIEALRILPDGAIKCTHKFEHVQYDPCKGGVVAPLFQRSCAAVIGRSCVSLYDIRSSCTNKPITLNILRSSMGTNAPARASISPEGTYVACIMDQSVNVYDFRRFSNTGGNINTGVAPICSMRFIADQKAICICWMPLSCGFSVATGNSTGDVIVHDVTTGRHTGTLFNHLRAACVNLSSFDGGILSQNATGVVNCHGSRSNIINDENGM